ncbi:MAG: TonB-dependent receptor [Candidatus Marinimicrobia bacterium]|nr:TonB-dependent receptor [Candidatus Neomarinimicrobiota bacterium]
MKLVIKVVLVFALIGTSFALGNAPFLRDTLKVFPFDPIVVTGTRVEMPKSDIPLSISVISKRVIDEQQHVPLLDLVSENVPGVFVTQRTNIGYGVGRGSGGQISVRGIGSFPNTQVLVLIDGRPDIMGLFGHPLGDVYFLYDIKKIEVIRGPASLLYGSNAMGGAINIITNHKHKKGFHINVPVRYGSFNTKQSFIRQSYQANQWGYSISGGYQDSDGFREDGDDSYSSASSNVEINAKISDNLKVFINSYISNLKVCDPRQVSAPSDTDWYDIKRRGGDITIRHEFGKFISDVKMHYNFGHHEIYDGYKSDDFTAGFVATETYQPTDYTRLLLGLDIRKYGGKALIGGNWKEESVEEKGLIFNFHQKLFKKVNLEGGMRFSSHSVAGKELIPALGISTILPYDWIIKAQYSKGYRNPTINELYLFLPSTTDLKPEISENIEATIEKKYKGLLNTSLTAFRIDAKNLIQKMGPPPQYQNVGSVKIKGIEWEGEILLPPNLSINWAASTSSFSQKIAGSPGEKLDLSLRYISMKGFFITLQGQWINNLYSVENPYAPPNVPLTYVKLNPYVILNLRGNYSINRYLDLYSAIDNITDSSYETMYRFPMPGRTFTIGITAKY